ncbi:MAG TPA: N-acetylmuramoyl-L-alanine amidase [Rhizomicrobium sp.]|nr:N-acetylmuramoyl-L-alanine amidase [Rhizomicrobium sp.]
MALGQSNLPPPNKTRAYAPGRLSSAPQPAPSPAEQPVRLSPDTAAPQPAQTRWYPAGQPADLDSLVKSTTKPAAQPIVMSVRIGEHPDRTRFVIELSDPVKLRVFTLANPNRVVIDMPEVLWHLNGPQKPTGNGAIHSYRYGLFRPGDSRFVIDLNMPVTTAEPMILPPSDGYGYRVVIDLFPVAQSKFEQLAGWPADLRAKETVAESAPIVPKHTSRKIVVVDAGHGGIDSGTIGIDGTMEKDVVLDEARRLGDALRKRGYIVHLTRDTDIYIPLRERVSIARGYGADLFISLHADSNPDASVTGASVYTLSEKGSDREAAALARKENQSDIIAGVDLTGQDDSVSHILIDLAQRDTMNRSSRFAEMLVPDLSGATDILPRTPHRSGALVVLKAPDVPAVLIELGYLSNASDCAQMHRDSWRNHVAGAIADAVDQFFGRVSAGRVSAGGQGAAE